MARTASGLNAKKLSPVGLIVLILVVAYLNRDRILGPGTGQTGAIQAGPGEYLFCSWNVENLFDDQDDRRNTADEEYDSWFAGASPDRELKFKKLTEILLKMNGGRGPDILCLVEVESIRAAELLRESLNRALPSGATPYGPCQMKEVAAGRHIAPAILTRLPVVPDKTRGYSPQRILETHLDVNGHALVIFATHWTSRRTDDGTGGKREKYADIVYSAAEKQFRQDHRSDIIVCGDFNDEPGDPAVVDHLHAGGDRDRVRIAKDRLLFLNLFADKAPRDYGTHYYTKPLIYDHICVSPGLLDDQGWTCLPDSVMTWTEGLIRPGATRRQPWRFGNRKDTEHRGYSDHFPVLATLKVK